MCDDEAYSCDGIKKAPPINLPTLGQYTQRTCVTDADCSGLDVSSCGDGASFSGSTQPRSHSWGAQHRGGGGGGSSYGRWESPGGGRVPSDPALALLGGHAPPLSHTRHRAPSDPSHMYKRGEGSRSRSSTRTAHRQSTSTKSANGKLMTRSGSAAGWA